MTYSEHLPCLRVQPGIELLQTNLSVPVRVKGLEDVVRDFRLLEAHGPESALELIHVREAVTACVEASKGLAKIDFRS